MKTIAKDQLVHGAYYEGYDSDEYPRVARWNANGNEFLAQLHHWEDTMILPLVYEGEDSEYFSQFSPVNLIEPKPFEIIEIDEEQGHDQDR